MAWWYVVAAHTRHECDATLVVVTPSASVAAWARRPLGLGHPGATLVPVVIGPDDVPVITDPEVAAQAPEIAVLSAIVHGETDAGLEVGRAALASLRDLDATHGALYTDIIYKRLRADARLPLEQQMGIENYQYQSEYALRYVAKGRAEGRAEGRAQAVLTVLAARGVNVTAEERTRVLACADDATLDAWLTRAVAAKSARDIFGQ